MTELLDYTYLASSFSNFMVLGSSNCQAYAITVLNYKLQQNLASRCTSH